MNFFTFHGWDNLPKILNEQEVSETADKMQSLFETVEVVDDPGRGKVKMIYNPEPCEWIFDRVHKLLESKLQATLSKTYWFSTEYHNGDYMLAHTDREACEISVSLNLYQDKPWALWVRSLGGNPTSHFTNPGDGLLYSGIQCSHWRDKYDGEKYIQLFLHYVNKFGNYSSYKDDQRV